jgi:hypothetical protein
MATMQREIDRPAVVTGSAVATLVRVLTWPVIGLLITGGFHFTIEAIWPDLKNSFVPAVLAPLLLAYGAWTGWRAIEASGNYVLAIVAAAILGVLPVALEIVGFGIVLGRGVEAGILAGVFGFSMIVFGSLIGAGFALSAERRATSR